MFSVVVFLQFFEIDIICFGCDVEINCMCLYLLNLEFGFEVIFVFYNFEIIDFLCVVYFIYIYGYKFQVIKIGLIFVDGSSVFLIFDIKCSDIFNNSVSECYNVKWVNVFWNDYKNIFDINLENGVYKDIVVVFFGGYVIVRIW